jgi:hypothetical protein
MSSKIDYISFGKEIDGTQYCSAIETQAENLIEDNENDAVIVFPAKDKWASLRSKDYRLTTENATAILPLPIYKIKKMAIRGLVDIATYKVSIQVSDTNEGYKWITVPLTSFVDENGNSFQDIDITEMIVTAEEWQALPLAESEEQYITGRYKDNTFFYEKNSNEILFSGTQFRIGSSFIGGIFADDTPVYQRLLKRVANKIRKFKYIYKASASYPTDQVFYLENVIGSVSNIVPINTDVRNLQYRIEYIPVSSKTKLRARKAAETTQEYIQPFNQRAELNAVSAFGKNMYLTAQKTGTPEIKVVKNYKNIADIPPIGALVRHNGKLYRLVVNSYHLYNTVFIQVTHTLSENWENRSKHIAVDQKYRNWNIPQDILWRNLYWEDYLICSSEKPTQSTKGSLPIAYAMGLFNKNPNINKTISYMAWIFKDNSYKGVVCPISTYGTANSLVFTATFKDALSAGLSKLDKDYCEEALYCKENGELDFATVILTSDIGVGYYNFEEGEYSGITATVEQLNKQSDLYPKIENIDQWTKGNAPKDEIFREDFRILKDAGEALKFTYQVHIMPSVADIGKIIIGNKFAELNPLIKRWETADKGLKVVYLTKYLRDGEDKLLTANIAEEKALEDYAGDFGFIGDDGLPIIESDYGFITINKITNENIKAWAIVDKDYHLIIGRNDTERSIYFSMSHSKL